MHHWEMDAPGGWPVLFLANEPSHLQCSWCTCFKTK